MSARFETLACVLTVSFALGGDLFATEQVNASHAAAGSLDGTWQVLSVIEDGQPVALTTVSQSLFRNGKFVIKDHSIVFTGPDGNVRTVAFVIDPSTQPKSIDLAGTVKVGAKGIYMRDGDTLLMCLPGSNATARPRQFSSLVGSEAVLMTLRRVKEPLPPLTISTTPPPPAKATLPTQPSMRQMLIGTWGHQTDKDVRKLTLNPDGSFSVEITYKKGLKKVFSGSDRSSGTWRLEDGELILKVSASTLKETQGQVYSYRITSISPSEVLYIDNQTGQRRIEWKLR